MKDQIFGMYPPSRCITPERLGVCASERNEGDKKGSHGIMDNHLPSTKNQISGIVRILVCQGQHTITMHWRKATKQQR